MEIRKIAGIAPDDRAAVDEAFAGIEPLPVACCNWPAEFPYAPEVSFRMFHTGDWLMLRFDVAERYTTLPCGEPFAERAGDNRWSLTLAIPPQALFRHALTDWSGLKARMNLYKSGDNLSHPHFLSWRPIRTEKPDFHRPEFFGEVTFEK